jgi:hypothetical protein
LIFVTVKCGVFFAVRTGFLNIIYMNSGSKGVSQCIYVSPEKVDDDDNNNEDRIHNTGSTD